MHYKQQVSLYLGWNDTLRFVWCRYTPPGRYQNQIQTSPINAIDSGSTICHILISILLYILGLNIMLIICFFSCVLLWLNVGRICPCLLGSFERYNVTSKIQCDWYNCSPSFCRVSLVNEMNCIFHWEGLLQLYWNVKPGLSLTPPASWLHHYVP